MFKVKVDLSEKGLKRNIYYCACWLIGGEENTIEDYGEDSEEGKRAKAWLLNRKQMAKDIVNNALTTVYGEGFEGEPTDNRLTEAYLQYPKKQIISWAYEAIDKLI